MVASGLISSDVFIRGCNDTTTPTDKIMYVKSHKRRITVVTINNEQQV